jgi:hypothetical protein
MCRTRPTVPITLLAFRPCEDCTRWPKVRGPEDLLEAVTEFLNEIQRSELELAFSHWLERVR